MKKKIIIVLLVLLILIISIFYIVINKANKNQNEALELFNEYAFFYIDLKRDAYNVEEVKQKIMKITYVKSVEVKSNEKKLDELNNMLNKYNLDTEYDATSLNNSFYVKFEFKNENLDDIKEIENNLMSEIEMIEGVEKIENSRFNQFINVYNAKGTNGLKQICKFFEETENMNSEELLQYYEDNQEFVDEYRQYI